MVRKSLGGNGSVSWGQQWFITEFTAGFRKTLPAQRFFFGKHRCRASTFAQKRYGAFCISRLHIKSGSPAKQILVIVTGATAIVTVEAGLEKPRAGIVTRSVGVAAGAAVIARKTAVVARLFVIAAALLMGVDALHAGLETKTLIVAAASLGRATLCAVIAERCGCVRMGADWSGN